MEIKSNQVSIVLVLLAWVFTAIWMVAEIKTEITGLQKDLSRIEDSNKELNDKMYAIMEMNGDNRKIWFNRK